MLCACDSGRTPTLFAKGAYPERLSDWGLLQHNGRELVVTSSAVPYDINMPLFSDYAGKLRTYWLPEGTQLTAEGAKAFAFPVGTVLTKTFFYGEHPQGVTKANDYRVQSRSLPLDDHRLIETRIMVHHADGWDAVSYRWQGDDAYLALTGGIVRLNLRDADADTEFAYLIPSRNECGSCHATNHTTGTLHPIGLTPTQTSRADVFAPGQNQLLTWEDAGALVNTASIEPLPTWQHDNADELTRAYLDVNCGHCHSPTGAADTSRLDLTFQQTDTRALGLCKPPIAAGRGSGGRRYSIEPGDPDASILLHRLRSRALDVRMPEIGRSLIHDEAVALVRDWIEDMPGECVQTQNTL